VAVEPSDTMIAQRPPDAAPVVKGVAEHLPFATKSFDAATAFLTTHHWSDLAAGLREMKRVARKRCVFFDHDMAGLHFWMLDYFPEARAWLKPLLPLETARAVFGEVRVVKVPVPHDCTDGFFCAYWRRPHAYLDAGVRASISFFARVDDVGARMAELARDLDDGSWGKRYGMLQRADEMDYGYRLVIAETQG
jgi:SAM-dependent methyltransferase